MSWKLTKQLGDEDNSRAKITLEKNSKLLTGKQAADKFAENWANESKIPVIASKQREARREMRERTARRITVEPMQQSLRFSKLLRALKKLKPSRSPGPDGITNEMLIHLGNAAVCEFLQIFNHSWEQVVLSQIRREAIMIPILKKEKVQRRQTAIDQLAWPAAWWKPRKALWMSDWNGIWKRRTSLHQNRQDSDSFEVLPLRLQSKSICRQSSQQENSIKGGVLSPILFLLLINDLVSELPKGIKAALYADDLVVWCKEEYATIQLQLQ